MPMTVAEVQKLYVAYFNRPADYLGLEYWKTQTPDAAAKAFAASAEYAATYAGMDVGARVNAIYQNLFGHAADLPGLTYWSTQIQQGKLSIADAVVGVSGGAQGTDLAAFNAKVTAATAFTTALDTSAEVVGYSGTAANDAAKAWLSGINSAAQATSATVKATLDASVAAVISSTGGAGGTEGQTFALTKEADTISGTAGNDVIRGVLGDADQEDGYTPSTFSAGDDISGGKGYDILRLVASSDADYYNGDGHGDGATVTGVEKLEIEQRSDGEEFYVDMRAFDAALEHIQVKWFTDEAGYVEFENLENEIKELTLVGVGDDEDPYVYFYYGKDELWAGDNDTLTLNLQNIGRDNGDYYGTVYSPNYGANEDYGNAIETLVINSTGTMGNSLYWNDDEDVVTTLNIKGSANLYFSMDEEGSLKSVDASALTASLMLDEIGVEQSLTIKGAQGDNDFYNDGGFDFDASSKTLNITTYAGADSVKAYGDQSSQTLVADLGAGDDYIEVSFQNATKAFNVTINAGAGNDVIDVDGAFRGMKLDVGSGEDAIIFGSTYGAKTGFEFTDTNAQILAGVVTVNGFGSDDTLDLSSYVYAFDWIAPSDVAALNTMTTLKDKLEYIVDDLGNDLAAFRWGSDTYVYVDAFGGSLDEGDFVIKLVGFTGSLGSSAADPSWLIGA